MTHNVLVYGTLRPGNAPTVLVPGVIYDLGSFPGIRLVEGSMVVCERITVDDEGLARLDRYEGYQEESPETSLYIRRRLTNAETGQDDYIYEYNDDLTDRGVNPIESGDWLEYRNQRHGSAAGLGSNARLGVC